MQKNLTRVVGLFFVSLVLLFTSMDYTVDAKQIIDENLLVKDWNLALSDGAISAIG